MSWLKCGLLQKLYQCQPLTVLLIPDCVFCHTDSAEYPIQTCLSAQKGGRMSLFVELIYAFSVDKILPGSFIPISYFCLITGKLHNNCQMSLQQESSEQVPHILTSCLLCSFTFFDIYFRDGSYRCLRFFWEVHDVINEDRNMTSDTEAPGPSLPLSPLQPSTPLGFTFNFSKQGPIVLGHFS